MESENKSETSVTTKYDNGGLCESCDPYCMNCNGAFDVTGFHVAARWEHDPDTMECPKTKWQATQNSEENYRRAHHGFNEREFSVNVWKLSQCKNPCHTKYWLYKNPYGDGKGPKIEVKSMCHSCSDCPGDSRMQVTHRDTGIMYEAPIKYYRETLDQLLAKIRGRLDEIQAELERVDKSGKK